MRRLVASGPARLSFSACALPPFDPPAGPLATAFTIITVPSNELISRIHDRMEFVARVWSSPGVSTERQSLFLAPYRSADRISDGGGVKGEHEGITVVERFAELAADIDQGRIADGKLLTLVLALRLRPPFSMTREQGSMVYAEAARRRGDDIRLMASIETIGWYSNERGSQRYPPLFNLFYPNHADFIVRIW
jgi:hypothetical protein